MSGFTGVPTPTVRLGETRIAFSRAETADLLGVSLPTLDRRIADGTLRTVKFGRRVVVPASAVEELLGGDPQ